MIRVLLLYFTQIADLNGVTPSGSVKVIQQFTRTNVTFSAADGIYPISVFYPAYSRNISLVNPALQGTLVMKLRTFFDVNNNNVLDANECAGDWIVYTITVNPSTGAISFTAGATTVCQNAVDETYTATAANSTSMVYSVLPTAAGVINATTGLMNWNAAFSGTATITATSTSLCGTTSASRMVTVYSFPIVTAGNYGPVSADAPDITLAGSPAGGIWSGTGVSGNQGTGYKFDPSSGTQTLNYAYTNPSGCTASASTTIIVNASSPRPQLQMTINALTVTANNDGLDDTGTLAVCNSSGNNLLVTKIADMNGLTPSSLVKVIQQFTRTNVTFSPENGITPINAYSLPINLNVALINASLQGTLKIQCRAFFDTNNNNVLDVSEVAGDWIIYTVMVNPLPIVSAGTYGPVSADAPDITLAGSPAGGIWSGTGVSGNQGVGYLFDPSSGTQTLNYAYTNPNGCMASASTTIVVTGNNPRPQLRMTINALTITANNDGLDDTGDLAVCNSTSDNLFVTKIADINGLTPSSLVKVIQQFTRTNVSFSPENGITPINAYSLPISLNVALINASLQGTLKIQCRAFIDTNNNNVLDASEVAGDWIIYTVTVNPIPTAPVVSITQPNCIVATGTITVTAPLGTGLTYSIGGAYQAGTVFSAVASGTYSVRVKNAGGCISAGTNVTINVRPPVLTVTLTAGPTSTGGFATLTATAAGGTPPYAYSLNGGGFQGDNTGSFGAGTYTVTVRDASGCTAVSNTVTIHSTNKSALIPSAIEKSAVVVPAIDLKVYPNPSQGPVTFDFKASVNAKVALDITSMSGQRIARIFDADIEADVTQTVIFDKSVAPGTYLYILRWNNEVVTGKFIIIR
jgi:hypothetical protein